MQIIERLVEYYDLQKKAGNIPKIGYTGTNVVGVIIFDVHGNLVDILPLGQGKKAVSMDLPVVSGRTGLSLKPSFAGDNSKYALGVEYDKNAKILKVSQKHFDVYAEWNKRLLSGYSQNPYVQAYLAFLDTYTPNLTTLTPYITQVLSRNGSLVFQLDGADKYLHELDEVTSAWEQSFTSVSDDAVIGQCSITGKQEVIARLHGGLKGLPGSTGGVMLVSFNGGAFESYGKEQSINASVGVTTASKYVLAFQKLVNENRMFLGDLQVLYWAVSIRENEYAAVLERLFGVNKTVKNKGESDDEYMERRKEIDKKNTETIQGILRQYQSGLPLASTPELKHLDNCRMYLLGFTNDKARVAIRFFKEITFYELVEKLIKHHADVSIYSNFEPRALSIKDVVKLAVPPTRKDEDLPATLLRGVSEAVLTGGMYPASLYSGAIARFKVSQSHDQYRAGIIKACLLRQAEFTKNNKLREELTYMLNTESTNIGYRLGRAFAVIEKLQKDAGNDTLRSSYFASASSTPSVVFPFLLRNANYYMKKAKSGDYLHKVLSEILEPVAEFPAHLSLEDQGKFILGYYQQTTELYRSKKNEDKEEKEHEQCDTE